MNNKYLQLLVFDYLAAIDSSLKLFEERFGSRSLFELLREKKISRRGGITEKITYQIHGVGCVIEYPDYSVDFDFCPSGRSDGFDAWRLFNYASEFPDRYARYSTFSIVEADLKESIALGEISKISHPYSNLYFLAGSVEAGDV